MQYSSSSRPVKRALDGCASTRLSKMKSRPAKPTQPQPPTGRPMTGRIARITSGQGQGYIRDKDGRSVFFDRRDLVDVKFNDLAVGDAVAFELIEDRYSGPRIY